MKDNILNNFITKMVTEPVDCEMFKRYIDMFSRFMGYVNPDYKYNHTYLSQYINDFLQLQEMLKKKEKLYFAILDELILTKYSFEMCIDRVFLARYSAEDGKKIAEYIKIDKNVIVAKSIKIKIQFELEGNEHIFCRTYNEFEASELAKIICENFEEYIDSKESR